MAIVIENLKKRVRAIINEYVDSTDTFATESDKILEDLILQAADEVISIAPNYYCQLTTLSVASTSLTKRADGRYYFAFDIPDGMVRPVSLVSSDLLKPIYEFIPQEDPRYSAQHSAQPGIGAGKYRPIAFIGGGKIEAHSVKGSTSTATLNYVKKPYYYTATGSTVTQINVNSVLEPALAYKAAQLMLEISNNQGSQLVAQNYNNIVKQWIN